MRMSVSTSPQAPHQLGDKVTLGQDNDGGDVPPASAPPPQSAPLDGNNNNATSGSNTDPSAANTANPSYPSSRRVTIGHTNNGHSTGSSGGGGGGGMMNSSDPSSGSNNMGFPAERNNSLAPMGGMIGDSRRGSMASAFGNLDDFFGRRPSFGFDMGMDNFFGRRDSTDSSTAALDMAIMEMSRRRYSTVGGPLSHLPPVGPNDMGMGGLGYQRNNSMGMGSALMPPAPGGGGGSVQGGPDSIAQRQQQLQQQQRELEQRQKELEFQRQQLIATMQERSYGPPGMGGGGMMHRGSYGAGLGGSLGLGSVHSQGSGSLPPPPPSGMHHGLPPGPPHHPSQLMMHSSAASTGSSGGGSSSAAAGRHWWICQICNNKAFASQEEAMSHEAVCQDGLVSRHRDSMAFLHSQDMGMGRNFSMGFGGMDTSQRGMSLGLGGMDNSTRGIVSMGMDSSRGGSMGFDSSRNMQLGMDSSGGHSYHNERGLSMGPFAMLSQPIPLAMPSDKDWLTPLHCFVRGNCVEVFTATEDDVATPSKGKRKPIQVGQIGIRCPHCRVYDSSNGTNRARERGSVYYPTSISSIYNATMNLLQRHLHNCPAVPDDIMRRYETLKADDARSGTSKRYWIESALSLGLVDTANGIRHSALRPPPLPSLTMQQETTGLDVARRNSNEFFGTKSNAMAEKEDPEEGSDDEGVDEDEKQDDALARAEREMTSSSPLVTMDDKPYATTFSFHLMGQMQPCVFTEADRLGKRKGLPPGFPGLACRHCFGGYGSGRFFPSSIKTLSDTSKTLNVLHNHMMRCRKCPADIKENLEKLRVSHDEERAKMKFGSQKAFFGRIWERLHGKGSSQHMLSPGSSRRSPAVKRPLTQAQHQPASTYPGLPQLHDNSEHHHHQQQQHHESVEPSSPAKRRPSSTEGLEALAAASSPSKSQKV